MKNLFGDRIKEERNRLGYSQDAFASLGGVSRNTQIRYEKNERKPDIEYLVGIARAGANLQHIVTGAIYNTDDIAQSIDQIPTDVAELVLMCNDLIQEQCKLAGFEMTPDLRHKLAIGMTHAVIKDFGLDFDKARGMVEQIIQISIEHQRINSETN